MFVILSGSIDLIRDDEKDGRRAFQSPGPGSMIGELAQLAGRPPLVDGYAREPVCALHIPPERLRALLIAEAELGERIMRALILRRMGILEKGTGGPIIVGQAGDGDARGEKVVGMKHPIAAPMRPLFSGTTAVWGIGSPRGRRKSATTANQSAQAPTMPASANALR